MFTGIVREVGSVRAAEPFSAGRRYEFGISEIGGDLAVGDSVAVNGVCLTVTDTGGDTFAADVMAESLRVTALGELAVGDAVNIERPMRADGRFDGHIVQGHVDGVGTLRSIEAEPNATTVHVAAPQSVLRYCVPKGSITLDGISLTIVDVDEDSFSVAIIPHTWDATNLHARSEGDSVNLEADVIAKYVERLTEFGPGA